MAFGLSAGAVALIGAAAPAVIGALTADEAAGAQQSGAQQASALQQEQYRQTRADLAPYRDTGALANNRLAQLLGLGSNMTGGFTPKTADQLRRELIGQYTTQGGGAGSGSMEDYYAKVRSFMQPGESGLSGSARAAARAREAGFMPPDQPQGAYVQTLMRGGADDGTWYEPKWDPNAGGMTSSVDEAGLQSAIQQALANQGGATAGTQIDDFGMLLKKYTGQDLVNDPGYQVRQSEGQKGVERSAAGRGGLFSGQAGKELQRFSQGLASTEFGNAFNRDQSYKGQVYGMLSGTSGAGQSAAAGTGAAGQSAAQQSGNYITQGANAEAAGLVGGANALTSGMNNYQNYNLLNSLYNNTQNSGASSAYVPMQPGGGY